MVFTLLGLTWCSLLAAVAPVDSALGRPGGLELTFNAVLQVEEQARAADKLVKRTEAMGGYFSNRTQESIEFRLPIAQADKWIDSLANIGLVVEKNLQTESLEGAWLELVSRLKAKRATLNDYYAMLKVSGDSTVFIIQNSITQLQQEMEETNHTILKLQDRMQFARLSVNFRFPDRTAPLPNGESRFIWLNRLDLRTLLDHFQYAGD